MLPKFDRPSKVVAVSVRLGAAANVASSSSFASPAFFTSLQISRFTSIADTTGADSLRTKRRASSATFGQRWIEKAQPGWTVQNAQGQWVKK